MSSFSELSSFEMYKKETAVHLIVDGDFDWESSYEWFCLDTRDWVQDDTSRSFQVVHLCISFWNKIGGRLEEKAISSIALVQSMTLKITVSYEGSFFSVGEVRHRK